MRTANCDQLDPAYVYPLYDTQTQAKVFEQGGITHKRPVHMTRQERSRCIRASMKPNPRHIRVEMVDQTPGARA